MKGRCLIKSGKLRKQANNFFVYEMNSSDKQNYTSHFTHIKYLQQKEVLDDFQTQQNDFFSDRNYCWCFKTLKP